MDLVAGVRTIHIITQHCTRDGAPKLVEACDYPLTGRGVVNRVYTDLAVIDVTEEGFVLVELAPGVDLAYVQARTAARIGDGRENRGEGG